MLERVAPKEILVKRVTLDHQLQESRENLEKLVGQGKRVNVGSWDHLEEENEESLASRDLRAIEVTKVTRELWDQGAHLVKKGIKEPQRSSTTMATSRRPCRVPLDHLGLKDYKDQRESQGLQVSQELMESRGSKVRKETWATQAFQVKKEELDFLDYRAPME